MVVPCNGTVIVSNENPVLIPRCSVVVRKVLIDFDNYTASRCSYYRSKWHLKIVGETSQSIVGLTSATVSVYDTICLPNGPRENVVRIILLRVFNFTLSYATSGRTPTNP